MTSTWTDVADFNAGDQIPADILTDMADDLDFLRNPPSGYYALSTGAANLTTSSATPVDLGSFSVTLTTQGNPVEVFFVGYVSSVNARFDIAYDGGSGFVYLSAATLGAPAANGALTIWRRVSLAAGTYTFKVQWYSTSGSVTFNAAGLGQLYVVERGGN